MTSKSRELEAHQHYNNPHGGSLGRPCISAAVWTPDKNGDRGREMAFSYQAAWGGWVFESTTKPGWYAWFDVSHTPTEVIAHPITRGHSGRLL